MPLITVRRTIWAAVLAVFAAVLLAAALPLIASTQIVRNRITQEMGSWSGYRVILGQAPEIRVWPNFHATLADVTLAEWGTDGRSPVIRAERVEIDLSAIAALRGEVTRQGLKATIAGRTVQDVARDMLAIAHQGLKNRNRLSGGMVDETNYLGELEDIAETGVTAAERLLELYHGAWQGNVGEVFEAFAY